MCILNKCWDISVHICVYARCKVCTCAHVCAFVHSALADEGEEGRLVYEGTCCLAWGLILTEEEIGALSVSSLSLT